MRFHFVPVPLRKFRPDLPGELSRVLEKAMSRDPEERYDSVEEFCRAFLKIPELCRASRCGMIPTTVIWRGGHGLTWI